MGWWRSPRPKHVVIFLNTIQRTFVWRKSDDMCLWQCLASCPWSLYPWGMWPDTRELGVRVVLEPVCRCLCPCLPSISLLACSLLPISSDLKREPYIRRAVKPNSPCGVIPLIGPFKNPVVTLRTTVGNIQQSYFLPTRCVYVFVRISEPIAIFPLHIINSSVFIPESVCLLCGTSWVFYIYIWDYS